MDAITRPKPRTQQCAAGTKKRTLFDIVNRDAGQRFIEPRIRTPEPPHPEGVAERRVSKDAAATVRLARGLALRDAALTRGSSA
jgi:hypothetical protein